MIPVQTYKQYSHRSSSSSTGYKCAGLGGREGIGGFEALGGGGGGGGGGALAPGEVGGVGAALDGVTDEVGGGGGGADLHNEYTLLSKSSPLA